ncbi:MAG: hypothetical protein GTN78_13050 [Gemmatimonadales bacterium]|nr:hypothetical protein [Gemmatimonadales bacterium]NIN13553.1 hypothetical protein [Gemmatimonadales bacterium]NIR01104.1 hypothetical protein [Gemmatimonadales bacterium]
MAPLLDGGVKVELRHIIDSYLLYVVRNSGSEEVLLRTCGRRLEGEPAAPVASLEVKTAQGWEVYASDACPQYGPGPLLVPGDTVRGLILVPAHRGTYRVAVTYSTASKPTAFARSDEFSVP